MKTKLFNQPILNAKVNRQGLIRMADLVFQSKGTLGFLAVYCYDLTGRQYDAFDEIKMIKKGRILQAVDLIIENLTKYGITVTNN